MIRSLLSAALLTLALSPAAGQSRRPFIVKTDLVAALNKRLNLSAEWRPNARNGWEIGADYLQAAGTPAVNGSWTVDYALEEFRYRYTYTNYYYKVKPGVYLGSG